MLAPDEPSQALENFREETLPDSDYWGLNLLSIILHLVGFVLCGLAVICFVFAIIPIPTNNRLGVIALLLATKTTAILLGTLCSLLGIGGISSGQMILLFVDMQSRLEHMENIISYFAEKIILADGK